MPLRGAFRLPKLSLSLGLSFSLCLLASTLLPNTSLLSSVSASEFLQIERPKALQELFPAGRANRGVAGVRGAIANPVVGQIDETPALFGMPDYMTQKTGILVWVPERTDASVTPNVKRRDGCEEIVPLSSPYWKKLFGNGANVDEKTSPAVILLVARGGCTFTTKVRNAQAAYRGNVVSVLVYNNEAYNDAMGLPYMQDDNSGGRDIKLSALMISQESATILTNELVKRENAATQGTAVPDPIVMHVNYFVPRPDNRVEYSLWTSSIDPPSSHFKTSFGKAARTLGDDAVLTPKYFNVDGETWGCTATTMPPPCGNQCLTGGKYCAADPEKDLNTGYDGKDIVMENIRQLCLWKYIQPKVDVDADPNLEVPVLIPGWLELQDGKSNIPFNQPRLWFDYQERLAAQCSGEPIGQKWKDSTCSFGVLESLDSLLPGLSARVKHCYDVSMGSLSSGHIKILDEEMVKQEASGIFVLPQAYVNKVAYYGTLACPDPIVPATCPILKMICSGFEVGKVPDYCVIKAAEETVVNNNTSSGSSVGAVIGIIFAFMVVAGAAVYVYMRRKNMEMRDDIDSLLKQYLPLEGNGVAAGNGANGGSSTSNQGITPGKKKARGQDALRLMGQTTHDEEDVQL